jgi:hypothetical protein
MKKKYDVKKVSRETLEDIAKDILNADAEGCQSVLFYLSNYPGFSSGCTLKSFLNEARVTLRTKAEVDADIAACMRRYAVLMDKYEPGRSLLTIQGFGAYDWPGKDLCKLLKEETSD